MAKQKKIEKRSLFEKVNGWLEQKEQIIFWVLFGITLLTGLLLYDPRVSLSGDDSSYILRADDFLKKNMFPAYQGPLYPLVLSLIILITGLNLMPLKLFSLAAILAFFYLTYRAFRRRIPMLLLFTMLVLSAINAHLLYYGSQTFSEAFYMFIQSLVVLVFFSSFIQKEEGEGVSFTWQKDMKRHLLLAVVVLALALTRTVGYAMVIAVIGYFACYKQWKNIGLFLICFALAFVVYSGITATVWDNEIIPSSQGSSLLDKNFYKPEMGKEDVGGLFVRFLTNSNQYLSGKLYEAMGVVKLGSKHILRTLITYLLAIVALIFSYRRNRYVFFTTLVTGLFLFTTFIILQTNWNQLRLIMPVYPYILLVLAAACYYLLELRKTRAWQFVFLIPVAVLFFAGVMDTKAQISTVREIESEFDGLTPDWRNYTKASRWIGDNLKDNSILVACRKPEISTIYAKGKPFYGIYTIPSIPLTEFLDTWRQGASCYVIYDLNKETTRRAMELIKPHYEGVITIRGNRQMIARYADQTQIPPILLTDNPITSPEALEDYLQSDLCIIYMADDLLFKLKDAGVTHILAANLRANPAVKDGETISTVERYTTFFAEKYPNLLIREYKEGADDDEPAQLFRIQWEELLSSD